MKKISTLLTRRRTLLRQARLANLAFALVTLQKFSVRTTRGQLYGRVTLAHAAPDAERYWASLTALEMSQSVIEEHFTDEEVMELADVVSFTTGNDALDLTFDVEDLDELFLRPLRDELEREGIIIDQPIADAGVSAD